MEAVFDKPEISNLIAEFISSDKPDSLSSRIAATLSIIDDTLAERRKVLGPSNGSNTTAEYPLPGDVIGYSLRLLRQEKEALARTTAAEEIPEQNYNAGIGKKVAGIAAGVMVTFGAAAYFMSNYSPFK